ncbi:MAG TPA: CxxC-x17-CxxC domain-containing protein, partial [Candidatus Thermoplasmatota archaeon]|nr:CxxC-x17-CxxC domain-containing protein [Candidatus Thermoplasmatota archaeon]
MESQRSMTQVTCSDCGQPTEVPFVPTPGRPVYC